MTPVLEQITVCLENVFPRYGLGLPGWGLGLKPRVTSLFPGRWAHPWRGRWWGRVSSPF